MEESMPLQSLNNEQLCLSSNGIAYSEEVDPSQIFLSQSQLEIVERFNNVINNITLNTDANKTEYSDNSIPAIDCKYYTLDEFKSQRYNSNKQSKDHYENKVLKPVLCHPCQYHLANVNFYFIFHLFFSVCLFLLLFYF